MDIEILKILSQVAGVGGIAFGVLLLVFREVIKKNIFPSLKKDHAYSLLKLIIVLTWSIALIGVAGWLVIGYKSSEKDQGQVTLSNFVIGKKDEGRFLEAVVNNTTSKKVLLSKIIYSRGVSSEEMVSITMCCVYCMQAWYAVQEGSVTTDTPGSRVSETMWYVRTGDDRKEYPGRVHYAPGCHKPLFAQIEMNISVVALPDSVTKVGVLWPNENKNRESKNTKLSNSNPPEEYDMGELLAEKDTVCVFLGIEGLPSLQKICMAENEIGERFL